MVLLKFIEKPLNQLERFKALLFLPAFSGLLLGIGFLFPGLGVLSWVALLPLLFFLKSKEVSFKKAFLAGFLTGFAFFGQVMSWGFNTWPLSWLGIDNEILGISLIFLLWLIFVSFLSLFLGLFSLSYWKLKREGWSILLLGPSLWIIFEYLRAWGFGIFFAGEESLLGPHWTFGNLTYSLSQNPSFRLLASIGGIYLVSFLIVFINVLFFFLIRKFKTRFSLILILITIVLISLSYFFPLTGILTEKDGFLKVAILQTKFPSFLSQTSTVAQERFQIQKRLIEEAFHSSSDLDILVFPENAHFFSYQQAEKILSDFSERDFLVIDSKKSVTTPYRSQKGFLTSYQKLLLVPIGDYLPYLLRWPGQVINKKWVERVETRRSYKKGQELQGNILFCSEVVSPVLYRQITQQDAQTLFNLGSLAFASGSKSLDTQVQAMLQFRAAENGRYLVRATNYGTSYIIDPKGEIVKKTSNLENQVLFGVILPLTSRSFYIKYGDWVLIVALFALLTFLLFRDRIKKRRLPEH